MVPVAILQVRQFFGQKKILLLALFLAIPIGLSALVRAFGDMQGPGVEVGVTFFLFFLYSQCVTPLLALLYGTGLLNAEIEGKTFTYLATRPIPKWQILLAKFAALGACLLGAALSSLTISWVILNHVGGGRLLGGLAAALTGSVLAYTAVFAAIGTIFNKRPMIVGLVAGVLEFAISWIPAMASRVTVTYFLRSIAMRIANPPYLHEFERFSQMADLPPALAVVGTVIALAVGVASWMANSREYLMSEQI